MTVAVQNAPPSTLADLIGQVVDKFDAMGDATPIMIGAKYLEDFGVGSAPRVLFVPEPGGTLGGPVEMGDAGSVTHSCDVYIRAEEGGGDVDRYRNADALHDRVFDAIQIAGTGRIGWGKFGDSSPTDTDAFGAEYAMSFTFTRAVRHAAALWSLPGATADSSAQRPGVPPGEAGTVDSFTVTTTPKES